MSLLNELARSLIVIYPCRIPELSAMIRAFIRCSFGYMGDTYNLYLEP